MTTILIVDDNPRVRQALRVCLELHQDWKVCGEAENGRVAIDLVRLRIDREALQERRRAMLLDEIACHLLDAAAKEVDLPFLELEQELWDSSGKRFTLFFDPGRIKRGLKPREEVGPALEEGKSYTFVVDRAWHDAQGDSLKDG